MKRNALALFTLAALAAPAAAAETDLEIAKQAQDPVAPLGIFATRNETDFGLGARGRARNSTVLAGAIPIALESADLMYRMELPLVWQPVDYARTGGAFGLGDLTNLLYFSPKVVLPVDLGAGPLLRLPLATDSTIGQHKWSVGVGAAATASPGRWVVGLSAANVWSLFGPKSRPRVNQLELRPVVSYFLPGGFFLTSEPTIHADWAAGGSDRWLVPMGGGAGKVFTLGTQRVTVTLEGYAPVVHPTSVSWPDLTIRARLAFLFPPR